MSERLHPASLLPISFHDPALVALMRERPSVDMVCHIAEQTRKIIQVQGDGIELPSKIRAFAAGKPTPAPTLPKTAEGERPVAPPALEDFLAHIISQSNLQVSTLLPTLIYLHRLHLRLPKVARGMLCPLARCFRSDSGLRYNL
jgi:PHO85 cyclin-1